MFSYWNEPDASLQGFYSEEEEKILFDWLHFLYTKYNVADIDRCFVNFMNGYIGKCSNNT